jgi:hypothetical protein
MTPLRLFDVVVLAALVAVCLVIVPRAIMMLRLYVGIRDRRLADGSAIAPDAPPAVAALAHRLSGRGFQRVGERTLVLPNGQRRFEWDLLGTGGTTYIGIVPAITMAGGALMVCYSAFADGAFVSTTFPRGATVDRPDLLSTPVSTSPEDAIATHVRTVADFARQHGPALTNHTMADLLARDVTYRTRHGGATLRRRVYGFTGLTALVVMAAAFELVRVLVIDR